VLELQLTYTSYNGQNLNSPAVSVFRGSTVFTYTLILFLFEWSQNCLTSCVTAVKVLVFFHQKNYFFPKYSFYSCLQTGLQCVTKSADVLFMYSLATCTTVLGLWTAILWQQRVPVGFHRSCCLPYLYPLFWNFCQTCDMTLRQASLSRVQKRGEEKTICIPIVSRTRDRSVPKVYVNITGRCEFFP
jgi:hypothetical protein